MAENLSTEAQTDVPAVAVRVYEKRGIYIDWSREKVHVMWAVGHNDAEGNFVQCGPDKTHYIKNETDENGEPVAGRQFWNQIKGHTTANALVSLIATHMRSEKKL